MRTHETSAPRGRADRVEDPRPLRPGRHLRAGTGAVIGLALAVLAAGEAVRADTPAMLDPNLQVTTFLGAGLNQPIGLVFLPATPPVVLDMLVLEKASGRVLRVQDGVILPDPVLDLAVNSSSERGLLSMALHPDFPDNPSVYIRWTESSTGADSTVSAEVPLNGNRVDRFTWDGTSLTIDAPIIAVRSRQNDAGQPERGNHNGGPIRFGPDGMLYIFLGDQGRRGWMQNLPDGPFLSPAPDDQYGGPAPDDAHLSGVILRLDGNGDAPPDNPFFDAGAAIGGEVGANIQKLYSYGHRNGFGIAFDPESGELWDNENADDAFSELNRVVPGMNGGWIQAGGPISRLPQFKLIETTQFGGGLQQNRWRPLRIAYTPAAALARMFMLPGATYVDPEFSWRYENGPAGAAFVEGDALGPENEGTYWMGSSRSFDQVGGTGGTLYRFHLTPDRLHVDTSADPRLADKVADNLGKFEGTESESLIVGTGFGTTPDIVQGPDGNLYVVSVTSNAIYQISLAP